MFEIVPSQWMKKCFEEIDFAFTDFQKATLIWNAPGRLRQEIFDALEELAEDTRDETLGRQINERLNYEKKIFETFIHNQSGKYVYVVENLEYENGGFFSDYNRALKYAKKYMQIYELKCRISKQMIVDTDADEIVRNPLRGNPNLGFETEEYCAYDGTAVASVTLNMSGEIEQFNSYELPEDEKIVDSYQVERFEYHFIKMPCPLQAGTTVKDIRNGSYYVLAGGEADWNRYLNRIEEKNWYVDFSDIQMICYKLTESGIWSHEHINPLYLEVEFPTYIEDDPKRQALRYATEALGAYLSHKSNGKEFCPDLVLKYARKYAEVCRKKMLIRKYAGRSLKSQKILCCRRRDKKKIYRIWRRYIMSRSYKHTPVYKGDKDRFAKKLANRRIRRRSKLNPNDGQSGKSNHYRKENESWDICDYRYWGEPIWREESCLNLRDYPELWQKCYRRK